MSSTSELMEGIKKQRELVSSLRQNVLDINKQVNSVYKVVKPNGLASGNVDEARESWQKYCEQLEETYESLEASTRQMARSKDKWNSAEMNRLHTFLLDALADPNNAEIYNKALKLTNTRDTTDNYTKYTQEFLKAFGGSTNRHRKLPKITPYAMTAHNEQIESCLKTLKDTATNKNRTLWRWLERNAYGGLLEVRAVYSSQSQQVDLVKMCIIVTNGVIDYIQFLATHEEWTYREENRKQVDLSVQSKYDYFRRVSAYANNMWVPSLTSSTSVPLHRCIVMFTSLPNFEQPCKNCKKYLKNFVPAITEKNERWLHESCK
ncbi:hypothetical protein M3Y94_01211100 [Aphelenchoides besseyi]|nr:hypothetical protein M3Y94_01211100 [Aphelenchoides besseyi]